MSEQQDRPDSRSRQSEVDKYVHVYENLETYHMGGARMEDATHDLRWGRSRLCSSYLDVGCGAGEMLDRAEYMGYTFVRGTEAVPGLCDGRRVREARVDQLALIESGSFDMATSFDVIEHLLPGDDDLLIYELGRIALKCIALTANNRNSIDPTTGNDLHINKREYSEWDAMIRRVLEPEGWTVERRRDVTYVSATWRAWR